ncbi:hypothetical protein NM688_g2439 [Phlebia brevispora]|uniref:Uncharacterized protein n=1 Tax=Phlebia brevispora TaxID=194682 RepID=A0ACC1T8Y8_9APHY|nr:hypothetical protein NM688_g2439 [Phlebia brevispora]
MHPIGTQVPCWTIYQSRLEDISVEYLDENALRTCGIAIPVNPSPHRPFLARPDSTAEQISRNAMELGVFKLEKPEE